MQSPLFNDWIKQNMIKNTKYNSEYPWNSRSAKLKIEISLYYLRFDSGLNQQHPSIISAITLDNYLLQRNISNHNVNNQIQILHLDGSQSPLRIWTAVKILNKLQHKFQTQIKFTEEGIANINKTMGNAFCNYFKLTSFMCLVLQ